MPLPPGDPCDDMFPKVLLSIVVGMLEALDKYNGLIKLFDLKI
jgi:hypothetical protein